MRPDGSTPPLDATTHPDAQPTDAFPPLSDTGWSPDTGLDAGPYDFGGDGGPPPRDAQPVPDSGEVNCDLGASVVCQCANRDLGHAMCVNGRYGSCVCPPQAPPPGTTEREILQWLQTNIIGTWRGIFSNPWRADALVEFTFRADRTFSSHCIIPTDCVSLYYGEDTTDARTWRLFDIYANGDGEGEIDFSFSGNRQSGEWVDVHLSADLRFLAFRIWNTTGRGRYGPMVYTLERVP